MTTEHQGLLAFGDSITNGGGELQWGVALQSWAQWLARSLGLPLTNYAVDGARVADVNAHQIPAHRRLNAVPDPRYQLGVLYIGANDVRSPDWDPVAYERELATALDYLRTRCGRVLTVTVPVDLGRPLAGGGRTVPQANAAIERQAQRAGALLLDLRDFGGRDRVMADHVHPTAMGQIEIAERALDVLIASGFATGTAPARPSEFATPHRGLRSTLRARWTYAYRSAKQRLRIALADARRAAAERRRS